ncbi:MAG: hypothetical protein N4A33_08770 [Bacteriovoracaceae bacterium]|jgi:hypothetical protein|nr:hypothetical protein [Bacteriovoracaceae bacterium]
MRIIIYISFLSLCAFANTQSYFEEQLKNNPHFEIDPALLNPQKSYQKKNKTKFKNTIISKKQLRDLLFNTPDYAYYKNGKYKNKLKVFLLCSSDRSYPCLFLMKDINDDFVMEDNSVWRLPGLALSRHGLPYNITNGSTPTGVMTLDSVMPLANNTKWYGEYRRVILNWIPNDNLMNQFLPVSSKNSDWWKQASIARDIGRKYLRIHGTGNINTDKKSSYYPHFATSGCISTREGKYDGTVYKDQRLLLDKMMTSLQLGPIFSNEVLIEGVLYVANITNKKKKVTFKDIEDLF